MIASSLLPNPSSYAGVIDSKTPEGSKFKSTGTAQDMKKFVLSDFTKKDETSSKEPVKRNLKEMAKMLESESSTNLSSESEDELVIKGKKTKQRNHKHLFTLIKLKSKKVEEPSAEKPKKKIQRRHDRAKAENRQ